MDRVMDLVYVGAMVAFFLALLAFAAACDKLGGRK
jgi:hypothetical protein